MGVHELMFYFLFVFLPCASRALEKMPVAVIFFKRTTMIQWHNDRTLLLHRRETMLKVSTLPLPRRAVHAHTQVHTTTAAVAANNNNNSTHSRPDLTPQ